MSLISRTKWMLRLSVILILCGLPFGSNGYNLFRRIFIWRKFPQISPLNIQELSIHPFSIYPFSIYPATNPPSTHPPDIRPTSTNPPNTDATITNTSSIHSPSTNASSTHTFIPNKTSSDALIPNPQSTPSPDIHPTSTNSPNPDATITNTSSIHSPSTNASSTHSPDIHPTSTNPPNPNATITNTSSIHPPSTNASSTHTSMTNKTSSDALIPNPQSTHSPSTNASSTHTSMNNKTSSDALIPNPQSTHSPSTNASSTHTSMTNKTNSDALIPNPQSTPSPSANASSTHASMTNKTSSDALIPNPQSTHSPSANASSTHTSMTNKTNSDALIPNPQSTPSPSTNASSTQKPIIDDPCKHLEPRIGRRGNFTVHYNYVPMDFVVCSETVTYTTHGDFRFFNNLNELAFLWKAPISVAVYAPGSDFQTTVESIKYVRNCGRKFTKKFITFHLYYDIDHPPNEIPDPAEILNTTSYNCSSTPPWKNSSLVSNTYRKEHNLLYAINVARNIARESAVTHYVLASDIELYPTPHLAKKFMEMINLKMSFWWTKYDKKVFVLPVFEIADNDVSPLSKEKLKSMIESGTAVAFHKYVCRECHEIPRYDDWLSREEDRSLRVFFSSERRGQYAFWEPVFIGTKDEPEYDERVTWEGQSDKRIQGWILCALDYKFLILNDAFLVHRGIKHYKPDPSKKKIIDETNALIRNTIVPEYKKRYGESTGCSV